MQKKEGFFGREKQSVAENDLSGLGTIPTPHLNIFKHASLKSAPA